MSVSGTKNAAKLRQNGPDHHVHRESHYFEDLINDPSCNVVVKEDQILIAAPDYRTFLLAKLKIKAAAGSKPIRGRYGDINAQ